MAKYERTVNGDFQTIVNTLNDAVMNGSISASLEDESDLSNGPFRCLVRVYERYSWFGSNRVSMTLVVAGTDVTAGGHWVTGADGTLSAGSASSYNVRYDGAGTLTLRGAHIGAGGILVEASADGTKRGRHRAHDRSRGRELGRGQRVAGQGRWRAGQ